MRKQSTLSTDSNGELSRSQLDWIRTKLDRAEKSGFATDSKEQLLAKIKLSHTP